MSERATANAILDAAFEVLTVHGIGRLSVHEVAKRAGLSRQTVYRYFPSRHELLVAVMLREHRTFEERIRRATAGQHTIRGAIEALTGEVLRSARAHPLFERLLSTEPETLLPMVTGRSGALLPEVAPLVAEVIADRLPHLSAVRVERTADALGRLLISYAVNPGDATIEELADGLAGVIVDGLKDQA